MPEDVDLWVRSAQADFQAAGHRSASLSDLYSMCIQIEEMVQSIALGLNEVVEVLRLTRLRIDHIESLIEAQQAAKQSRPAKPVAKVRGAGAA